MSLVETIVYPALSIVLTVALLFLLYRLWQQLTKYCTCLLLLGLFPALTIAGYYYYYHFFQTTTETGWLLQTVFFFLE
jgi:hypothetical protein